MKPDRTEDKLQAFLKRDPFYLKTYVREHPDNKMAWYLLGREYEEQGKKGKALYCYAQAGEIYEAYENQTIQLPPDVLEPIRQWKARAVRSRRKRYLRWTALSLVAAAAIVYAPLHNTESPKAESVLPAGMTPQQLQETKVYYLSGPKSKEAVGSALQEMLLQEWIASYGILTRGVAIGQTHWIGWLKKPELLISVEAKGDASQQQISYLDRASCNCQPGDSGKAAEIVAAWMIRQEQELALRSAVASYIRRTGRAPESPSDLTQSYPSNTLPGLTPYMQEQYERQKETMITEIAAWVRQHPQPAGEPLPAQASAAAQTAGGKLTKPLNEPMRIVVDKTAHRLAVLSGNMIVRNYPVGLGGDRTPEGSFTISEKVRNPNGKSNGEFGSRGMTLSDTQYAIHGTNKPASMEKDQSLGCVRMLKDDVEELFDLVPLGTPVTIGKGLLPEEIERREAPYTVPLFSEETNPGKVYKWLD
ncbi:L,D-transpeptidase family protein [Paenibacillus filicis]|uniref:L,D-transpeptidase family protein n=1 Tax=Paenibacillus gyeongsangnamensis TaxID=3388067 RepID=A0ABT4Q5M9_9BACL|nr:L,D-transpeptidase [Paenibacillus filicis]MCZ8512106.1 L,D-transpeptidase family protein [Paenibacillus filicis]